MINPAILAFIKQQLAEGKDSTTIKSDLITHGGWASSDIEEAFSALGIQNSMPQAVFRAGGVPVSPLPNIAQSVPVKYAGFWIRFVAIWVDWLIIVIPDTLIRLGLASVIGSAVNSRLINLLDFVLTVLVTWLYFSWMTYAKGATLGKMLVGITVKSDDFQSLSFGKVILRETIGKFISTIILFIGYIMAGFTEKKQALHDKFAHSVVVYKNPSNPNKAGLIVGIILAALLPGIAIVGILASVVLSSLNIAREKGQSAQIANTAPTVVSTSLYSYTLPSGWITIPNSAVAGLQQAGNKNTGDNLSIITNTLPANYANAGSITQIISADDIGKVALADFKGATLDNVSTGMVDGKTAYVVKLSRTVTSNSGSELESIVQYSAINNGAIYNLVFIAATSREDQAQTDFQSILNSFQFR